MDAKVTNRRRQIARSKFEAHLNLVMHYMVRDTRLSSGLEERIGLSFVDSRGLQRYQSDNLAQGRDKMFTSEAIEVYWEDRQRNSSVRDIQLLESKEEDDEDLLMAKIYREVAHSRISEM